MTIRPSDHPQPLLRRKMPELDSIRGIAILMVLFYHGFASRFGTYGLSGLPKTFVRILTPGWAGVNLFFALSGFLITGILLDSKESPQYYLRFYVRRALRILPAYYVLLILVAILGRYALQGETVSWGFLGLSAIYLANLTTLFGVPNQFAVLWSLAVEEHYYLLWPLVVRNLSRRNAGVASLVIAAGVTLARLLAWKLGYDYFASYTWLVADGLAFGSFLVVAVRGPLGSRTGVKLMILSACLISCALVLLDRFWGHPVAGGVLHLTALNLFCTGIVATALLLGTNSWSFLVQHRGLKFFGDISYGLYLIHMLVFNLFDNLQPLIFPQMPPFQGHFNVMLVRFVACGGLSVLLAYLSRRYFEERFLRLKDRAMFLGGRTGRLQVEEARPA